MRGDFTHAGFQIAKSINVSICKLSCGVMLYYFYNKIEEAN